MPINTPHPLYKKHLKTWKKCRHVCQGGEDTVKRKGETYLPPLSSQKNQSGLRNNTYEAYKTRAMFYPASERTVAGLLGAVFRKKPTVVPEIMETTSVGRNQEKLFLLSLQVLSEVLITARVGVLVDANEEGNVQSKAYITRFRPETIINWKHELGPDGLHLTKVVLEEAYPEEGQDEFEHKTKVQYRVLRLKDGVYTQEIYREGGKGKWISYKTITPKVVGKTLDYIPFSFINPLDDSSDYYNPPLLSVVNVNLSHYRSSADLKNGLHFCGTPIPYAAGFDIKGDEFHVGSETGYVSPKEGATIGFGEMRGKSLEYLMKDMDKDEERMAALATRMLEQPQKGTEKPEAIRLRQVGEQNTLRQMVNSVSESMTKVLGWWNAFNSNAMEEIIFQLNTDFISDKVTPAELKEYIYAVQSGTWSRDTAFYNMKRGECYPEGRTFEDEEQLIQDQMDILSEE